MITHQESKMGGGSPDRVFDSSQFTLQLHTRSTHKPIYKSIISVIYEQKKELLDTNKIEAFRKI